MTSNTTAATPGLAAAHTAYTALEEEYRTAQHEADAAQEYADALPGRLAAGDDSVSADALIQAGPSAAVAQAKAQAVGQRLTAAREALVQAEADELASRLRTGNPFLDNRAIDAEVEAIAVQVRKPLDALAERFAAHNLALSAVTGTADRNTGARYTLSDGETLNVTRQGIELDGVWRLPLSPEHIGTMVLTKIREVKIQERTEAQETHSVAHHDNTVS